uniref:Biotin carboxyl carrier protein of acetyl-CoA carboxylase n=1 Tax=Sporolithon durum TaxID=48970 RepID=A0A141SCQ2_9FLOR|nr:acetyl-CoA carboxylase biotin carboxyl carrier protein [Sporolithon durum]AMK96070.1 acetyl-CoA carboxylase biotin carboxyl carrier protein [Sporolithon durum]
MQFTITELKTFLSSIKKRKIELINIKSKNLKIIINKDFNIEIKQIKSNAIEEVNKKINKTQIYQNNQKIVRNKTREKDTFFTIVSPMIGTFYRSPGPNEPHFVEINDVVKINQTVCIIEAMKLMNEIESEINGHIVEILVQDGDIVDCGQALMKIKPD